MKKCTVFFLLALAITGRAQVLVNIQVPPVGLIQKPQLWNMVLSNASGTTLTLHAELLLTEASGGQQVLSGTTGNFTLATGTVPLNAGTIGNIQYNVLGSGYAIDASPAGLLPPGHFLACFSFWKHSGDVVEVIAEECIELLVEPMAPPMLIQPYDGVGIESQNPLFTWLPPSPAGLFNNLRYQFDLVELGVNQTAVDAIQQNVPVFSQDQLQGLSLQYPLSAYPLVYGKTYAWRITATSNNAPVSPSETWTFTPRQFNRIDSMVKGDLPFARLLRNDEAGYAIFSGEIKFEYINETADSIWHIRVVDLSLSSRPGWELDMDSLPMRRGQNLVRYQVKEEDAFIDKHMYQLELVNSRNEIWRLRFEYRQPQAINETENQN